MQTEFTQPATTYKSKVRPLSILASLVLVVLLGGAVVSTASAAQLSFQVAELQQEEFQLQQREQYLKEKLAQAQSLSALRVYAQEQGFSEPATTIASLDLAPVLAQLP